MRGYFLDNIDIDGKGGVVAAPDHNTGPGGNYYYHWERDGALSMEALQKTAASFSDVKEKMAHYAAWVQGRQQLKDPNGQDTVLTEPKYMLEPSSKYGEVFTDPWCRPQNDGPGLRAKTLIGYAEALALEAKTNSTSSTDLKFSSPADLWPIIKIDLDWVKDNWHTNGCDLWEEIRSEDFFWNRYNFRASLLLGAKFATAQGDSGRASAYASAASDVEKTLMNHYQDGYVYETQDSGRKKDAAVMCAFNDGFLKDHPMFLPTGPEVAGTIKELNGVFCPYDINTADTKAGVPGILYGRYEGDNYDRGNPWILLTAALAEQLYRGATMLREEAAMNSESLSMNDETWKTWEQILGSPVQVEAQASASMRARTMATALSGAGDGVLLRIRQHVKGDDFRLWEQIDKETGKQKSAHDLTWSYATVLKAMTARAASEALA